MGADPAVSYHAKEVEMPKASQREKRYRGQNPARLSLLSSASVRFMMTVMVTEVSSNRNAMPKSYIVREMIVNPRACKK